RIEPRDVIMVLGTADDVTPFHRGAALAKRWHIPPENLFLRPMGHFSAALDLIRDPAPLRRLAERLRRGWRSGGGASRPLLQNRFSRKKRPPPPAVARWRRTNP